MIKPLFALLLAALAFAAPLHAADSTKRATPVAVGEKAPDFTLMDQNGRKHTLSAALARGPVVLVFYRGYW
jgi:cytochrome oxidase Cu insertion factor (SCO1/SenC/PrrC family)